MTNNNINKVFIRCSSQTICGIKPANLFSVSSDEFSEEIFTGWRNSVHKLGLSITALKKTSNTEGYLLFIYDFTWIRQILGDCFIQSYLCGKGYTAPTDTKKTLNELFFRLQTSESFPHEVGIFLGYPIEDVISFEEKEGKFCKYCGYWKSYCNPEEAKRCCDRYKQCSEMCKQWFEEGYSIPQIIRKYKEMAQKAA